VKKWIARKILGLIGWKSDGVRPPHDHYVLIAAPHTSNWDLPLLLLFAAVFDIKITWMAKHQLFYPPMGWIMRALGGMPIVRHKNANVVSSVIETIANMPELIVVVPTEGTRSRMEFWKSGFYHIAHGAGVPIVPSFLDYSRKVGGFGQPLITTGNISEDMNYFREFYAPVQGKFPAQFGPIKLREEES
jgi:1-acyl-sn-glycerol-3-phosphate acyltransferase